MNRIFCNAFIVRGSLEFVRVMRGKRLASILLLLILNTSVMAYGSERLVIRITKLTPPTAADVTDMVAEAWINPRWISGRPAITLPPYWKSAGFIGLVARLPLGFIEGEADSDIELTKNHQEHTVADYTHSEFTSLRKT